MIKEGTIEKVIPTTTKPAPKSTTRNDRQTREKSSEVLFKIVQELKDQCDLDDDRWIERVWDEMRVLLASTGSDFQKRHPEINFKKFKSRPMKFGIDTHAQKAQNKRLKENPRQHMSSYRKIQLAKSDTDVYHFLCWVF